MNNWYGFEKGTNQYSLSKVFTSTENFVPHNQIELAESYGITKQTMNNYMRMASMIPELEDWVETGIVIAECTELYGVQMILRVIWEVGVGEYKSY